jgi:hypothetical protein
VRDEVLRGEVRLEAAAPELGEVGVRREAEQPLHEVSEHRLGEELLVLARAVSAEVLAEVPPSVQLPVPPRGPI